MAGRFAGLAAGIGAGSIGIAVLTIEGGQNLNFAIPIDYARGMLGMSQTQPLASIYEPEPTPDTKSESSPEAAKMPAVSVASAIPDEMRQGAFAFLEKKMGTWKLDDARHSLGEPIRQRDSFNGKKVDGVVYAFPDRTGAAAEFELDFANSTGVLRRVFAHPGAVHPMRLVEAQSVWGQNYKETKNANGTRTYIYRNRRLLLITDKDGAVITIGVYLP
jgi:hypothetical protein